MYVSVDIVEEMLKDFGGVAYFRTPLDTIAEAWLESSVDWAGPLSTLNDILVMQEAYGMTEDIFEDADVIIKTEEEKIFHLAIGERDGYIKIPYDNQFEWPAI